MHIRSLASAQIPEVTGKSKEVPPGLNRREFELPPGIAKKLEAGGTAPAGILQRFPAAARAQFQPTTPDASTSTSSQQVDISV